MSVVARVTRDAPSSPRTRRDTGHLLFDAGRRAVALDDQQRARAGRHNRASDVRLHRPQRVLVDQLDRGGNHASRDECAHGVDGVPHVVKADKVARAGGCGIRRSVIFVMIASVPSDPTSNCVRS